jgi:hypothetical protein
MMEKYYEKGYQDIEKGLGEVEARDNMQRWYHHLKLLTNNKIWHRRMIKFNNINIII